VYPFVHLPGGYEIPIYYLVLSLDVCLLLVWLRRRTLSLGLDLKIAWDTALVAMIAAFVGARLFHVVYENPEIYRENPWAIFYFWNGGFVFYGGALMTALCGWLFLYRQQAQVSAYFDLFTPVCSLGYAIGRWACFLAGCCYGKTCHLPWAVEGRHPTQLYASFWEFGVLLILLGLEKKNHKPGKIFFLWLILHAAGRILMETYRDDFRGAAPLFSISTWISLVLIAAGAIGLTRLAKSSGTL
jgi:phosphatidylglycerol:prolipoprotein diacylglycerol transferase